VGADDARPPGLPRAVRVGVGGGAHVLRRVRAEAVVEDHVRVDAEAGGVGGGDGGEELVFGAVLGADGAALVELAEVVQVIDLCQ